MMSDNNTVYLTKHDAGETISIRYTIEQVPVDPIIAHQDDIHCSSFDEDFKEKIRALKPGEQSSHTFPVPVLFERMPTGIPTNLWGVRRMS